MRNIEVKIVFNDKQLGEYVTDIVPVVGDCIEIPGSTGMYCVTDRIFVAAKNRVRLLVDMVML